MNAKLFQHPFLRGFQFFLVVLLVLGIYFRFVNLDRKVYWLDETHTSLRISGYTEPEFIQEIFAGNPVTPVDLLKYQHPTPSKGLGETLKVLAGNTEHAPLYYLLARFWVQWFGSSVAVIRSLSAVISLLAFPCIYWLCQELFASAWVGALAIALVAVSPFHVLYAQEARPYSLLTVAILLSSAALLRAIRVKTKLSWVAYGLTVALGLYSHWFFVFVAIAHSIYVTLTAKLRLTQTLVSYVMASLAGLVVFSPWIFITVTAPPPLRQQMGWVYQKTPLITLAQSWGLSVSRVFFDLDRGWCWPPNRSSCNYLLSPDQLWIYLLIVPLLLLVGSALYFLCKNTKKSTWLFILSLISIMALGLIVPDLMLGGKRSSVTRYLIPCLLGIQLTVAYYLATKIVSSPPVQHQRRWKILLVTVLSLGVLSCSVSSQAEAWWNKGDNYHVAPIARTLNAAEHPLVLYSVPSEVVWGKGGAVGRVMPLVRLLKQDTHLLFVVEPQVPQKLPSGFKNIFVYRPHEQLKTWTETELASRLEPVITSQSNEKPRLWKVLSLKGQAQS